MTPFFLDDHDGWCRHAGVYPLAEGHRHRTALATQPVAPPVFHHMPESLRVIEEVRRHDLAAPPSSFIGSQGRELQEPEEQPRSACMRTRISHHGRTKHT